MWLPQNAIIAVTYRCNGRCLTCDIWKKKNKKALPPHFYSRLPFSLKDINLTGGEPFLRSDLPDIVRVIKKTCPKARIVINTNGLLPEKIFSLSRKIKQIDPKIAIRVSLDGLEKIHDQIRGVKGSFQKALLTSEKLRKIPIKDLGISFNLMEKNKNDLLPLFQLAQKKKWQFSLTTPTSSSIFFGTNKEKLRPRIGKTINFILKKLEKEYYQSLSPKNWLRGWFAHSLWQYLQKGKRSFSCDAGANFFYLDPLGNVYPCHLKNWCLGNLDKENFEKIWKKANQYQQQIQKCQDCWMICTTKASLQKNLTKIIRQVFYGKILSLFQLKSGKNL